jgi:hypothetical protein
MSQTIVLGSPVRCADAKGGIALLQPRVTGVVLDAQATHLDYLVVHRGLLGGHNQCVPASDIHTADPQGVQLTIRAEELKALPELEAKVTGGAYTQRSVPEDSLVLTRGVPVTNESRLVIGHFYGVIVGLGRQIEQILINQSVHSAIPIDQFIRCTEDSLQAWGIPAT